MDSRRLGKLAKEVVGKTVECTTPCQTAGYQKTTMRIFSKVITPESVSWGFSKGFAWIRAKSMRE